MEFFKNISINLKASGPTAVIAVWLIAVVCVGIFGNGVMGERAMGILMAAIGFIPILIAAHRSDQ